jgi:hypothetical protein
MRPETQTGRCKRRNHDRNQERNQEASQQGGTNLMASNLKGKKIAILATDGFEQSELMEPRKAFDAAGATTVVIAPKSGEIKGWKLKDWGESVKVDKTLENANPSRAIIDAVTRGVHQVRAA